MNISKSLISILTLLFFTNASAQVCEYKVPEKKRQKQEQIRKAFEEYANRQVFAKTADAMLSRLILAKSPMITKWVERRGLDLSKPEIVAREWRLYYLKSFEIPTYSKMPKANKEATQELYRAQWEILFSQGEKKNYERAFLRAKLAALKFLKKVNAPNEITAKVRAIQPVIEREIEKTTYRTYPLEFFDLGISYAREENVIQIGTLSLQYPTQDDLVAVFLHEIGHSFDECRLERGFSKRSYDFFSKTRQCLRQTYQLKTRDDSKLEAMLSAKRLTKADVGFYKTYKSCDKSNYPPEGIQRDQINENFADWFAGQVIKEMGLKVKTLRSDLCVETELKKGSAYLPNSVRRSVFISPKCSL